MSQSTDLLDDEVDGLGAAVGDPAGGEVGQDLGPPLSQRPPEPGDLGDRAGVQGLEEPLRDLLAGGRRAGAVDRPEPLIDAPGEFDFPVRVPDRQPPLEPLALPIGEVLDAGEQGPADPVERVVLVTAFLRSLKARGLAGTQLLIATPTPV